ncbi:MAG: hypothetical protein Q8O46_02500, partial [bacterium]|nr:hypothetical protein [bacterium]
MSTRKSKKIYSDKKYYILDSYSTIMPVDNYKFDKTEICLKSLVDSECFFKTPKYKDKKTKLNKMIKEMG